MADRNAEAMQRRAIDKAVKQFTDLKAAAQAGTLINKDDYEPVACSGCGAVEFVIVQLCRMMRKKSAPEDLDQAARGEREMIMCGVCEKPVDELGRIQEVPDADA